MFLMGMGPIASGAATHGPVHRPRWRRISPSELEKRRSKAHHSFRQVPVKMRWMGAQDYKKFPKWSAGIQHLEPSLPYRGRGTVRVFCATAGMDKIMVRLVV